MDADKLKKLQILLLGSPLPVVFLITGLLYTIKAESKEQVQSNQQQITFNSDIPEPASHKKTAQNQLDAFFQAEQKKAPEIDIESYSFAEANKKPSSQELESEINSIEQSYSTTSQEGLQHELYPEKQIVAKQPSRSTYTHTPAVKYEPINESENDLTEEHIKAETEKRRKERNKRLAAAGIPLPDHLKYEPINESENDQIDITQSSQPAVSSIQTSQSGKRTRKGSAFFSTSSNNKIGNMTPAVVHGDQEISNGSVVKLRLLQNIELDNGVVIPANHYVYGTANINQDRVNITISTIAINNNSYALKREVCDNTGISGIFIPQLANAQDINNAGIDVVDQITQVGRTTGVTGRVAASVIQSGKNILRKNANE
ncbi:MAG: conjugative transposon protein TraM, partial [Bacteroidales bacterium]